jgi:hypothetical protein
MDEVNFLGNEAIVDLDVTVDFPIDDTQLVAVFDERLKASKENDEKLQIGKRSGENYDYWRGKQIKLEDLQEHETPYMDNIIWQDSRHQIATAVSKMPDILVMPGNTVKEQQENAKILEKRLNQHVPMLKRILRDGLRNLSIDYKAAIKVVWEPNADEGRGDYKFYLCRSNKFGFNKTATIPQDGFTSDNMTFIYEYINEPISLIMAKFPGAKEKLRQLYNVDSGQPGSRNSRDEIDYVEGWFTYYDKQGKLHDFVAWKHNNIILGKDMNPYYDFEGYYKPKFDAEGLMEFDEPNFRNFFDRPRKPFIFLSYENTGRSAYEDTSPIEQTWYLQRSVNKRGAQITLIADRMVPKLAFNKAMGTRENVAQVTNDVNEHIFIDSNEDIRTMVTSFSSAPPSPMLYQDQQANRQQIDSKFAANAGARGETVSNESGISKQITREGNLVTSDDIAEIVVERAVFEMASWAIQMMKLKYDKDHYVRDMGKDGELVNEVINQDKIDDGIAVQVKAETTGKSERREIALGLAKIKAIDPLTLMEDLDVTNPKQRTKRLIAYLTGDQDGYQRYLQEAGLMDDEKLAGAPAEAPAGAQPEGTPPPVSGMDGQQALLDIQQIQSGQMPEINGTPSPEYAQALVAFYNSGEFEAMPPEQQQMFVQHIKAIKAAIGGEQPAPAPAPEAVQQPVQPIPVPEQPQGVPVQ